MLMNFNTAVEQMGCLGASFRGKGFGFLYYQLVQDLVG